MLRRVVAKAVGFALAAVVVSAGPLLGADLRWVGTWATSSSSLKVFPGGAGVGSPTPFAQGFEKQTLRSVVPTTVGGTTVRVRFSNLRGERTFLIEDVTVALAAKGAVLKPQTIRKVTFSGRSMTFIPAGAYVYS